MSLRKNKIIAAATSLWLIVTVALVCRFGYAYEQVRETPPDVLVSVSFAQEAGNIGMALATGKGFASPTRGHTGPTAWLAPVYPLIVAGIFRVFGLFTLRAFYAAAALNLLFSAATCVPIYFAARRIAGATAASLAAWMWALFPNAIVIPYQWIWDTALTGLLAAAILWATLAIADSRRTRDWCAYGFLWGFALLTNPSLGAALPLLFGWLAYREWRERETRRRFAKPALALGVAFLCCVPWTIRNYVQFHRLIPLRSNFAFELWLGNNRVFDDRSRDVNARVTPYEESRLYAELGETAFMQEKWDLATEFIRTHKRLELRLTRWRFLSFWLGSFRPLQDFAIAELWLQAILVLSFLTAIAGAIGIVVLLVRRSPYAFPAAAFVIVFPLVYYVTHASLRYRHPIDPIVLILTTVALTGGGGIPDCRESPGGTRFRGESGHAA
ncbi:MAG TPA: glycosyltransferase family 39 protein [Candidatus Acidoferrales bacterium]|nr:glycosyltransferase family 39 protein [Candidatus Acidoferrales bacterium]